MAQLLSVVAELKARPGKEDDLRRVLLTLIEPTRAEDGCVQYDLHVHSAEPTRFVFYENWNSREHLDRHLSSPHLTAAVGAAGDLLAEPPRIETYWRIA
ncbi:MAG: putative quinol monooxygenase [Acidobacteriota bacterium]